MPNAALAVANESLCIGPAGLELVRAFETCMKAIPSQKGRFTTYLDSAGVLTIGWGHTKHHLPRFAPGAVWSRAECDAALAGDMMTFERQVHGLCHVSLEQHEFAALVSWAFTTGGPARATLWKQLN